MTITEIVMLMYPSIAFRGKDLTVSVFTGETLQEKETKVEARFHTSP